jgi:hypothetical protein
MFHESLNSTQHNPSLCALQVSQHVAGGESSQASTSQEHSACSLSGQQRAVRVRHGNNDSGSNTKEGQTSDGQSGGRVAVRGQ